MTQAQFVRNRGDGMTCADLNRAIDRARRRNPIRKIRPVKAFEFPSQRRCAVFSERFERVDSENHSHSKSVMDIEPIAIVRFGAMAMIDIQTENLGHPPRRLSDAGVGNSATGKPCNFSKLWRSVPTARRDANGNRVALETIRHAERSAHGIEAVENHLPVDQSRRRRRQ